MAERALDTRSLNRALLARQHLLQRSRLPLTRVIEQMGGLQTQYAPSGYIGLWSRLVGFERPQLTRALESGRVIQGTLMRATIHMVTSRDYPLLAGAVRRSRRNWWLQTTKGQILDETGTRRVDDILRRVLADGPRRRSDLIQVLAEHGFPKEAWQGAGLWIDLIRVPPSGTWERRRADIYGLAPEPDPSVTEDQGLEHLVLRYLGGFGPATIADLSSWGGIPNTTLAPVLERMDLRRFRSESDAELIDLPRRPLPDPATPAPVRFLPTWDASLLVHARRTQILPEVYRSAIFNTRNPQSLTTFLVDGAVAGVWKKEEGPKLTLEPFAPIPRPYRRELEDEADRLAQFLS
jgi:hypothetical protein